MRNILAFLPNDLWSGCFEGILSLWTSKLIIDELSDLEIHFVSNKAVHSNVSSGLLPQILSTWATRTLRLGRPFQYVHAQQFDGYTEGFFRKFLYKKINT